MARILGLEEIPYKLRSELQGSLRVCDEAVVLPSAGRSLESGAFKNVVFRLSGTDTDLNPDIFSPAWFAGVSAVTVPTEVADMVLKDPSKRQKALEKLRDKIASEMADADLQVGPGLDGDDDDRDTAGWTAGFDSGSCCVGLYSARQSRAPEAGLSGMNRAHDAYYLVCKAGGGVAAQTFHARLTSALRAGKSLDECFEPGASPGAQALRRVSIAAQRMRKRILAEAAAALGFVALDTISDNAASPDAPIRGCIPSIDATYNCLRKIDGVARSTWQYAAGCVDTQISQGLLSSSNLAEGFIAFTSSTDEFRVQVRNEAHNAVPFVTPRLNIGRDLVTKAAEEHKRAVSRGGSATAHPDAAFITQRFSWKSKAMEPLAISQRIEPPALWGSHMSEAFLANWARELGLATFKVIRMAPEIVCVAAMEPAKLRAAVKRVQEAL